MRDSDAEPEEKQQLAEQRTEAAYERTLMAEERTYSAWLRTGLAAAATGFAIAQLMSETGPTWLVRLLAVLFIVAGGAMFVLAFWAYRNALRKLRVMPTGGVPVWAMGVLSAALLAGAAISLILVFRS